MRPIDADELKDKANDTDYMPTGKWLSLSDLEAALTIEPKRGRWEYIGGYGYQYRCSNCIMCAEKKTAYCPNCGAKMDGSKE